MTRAQTETKMEDSQSERSAFEAKMEEEFKLQMKGRLYGKEETRDARAWFYLGYRAGAQNMLLGNIKAKS